MSRARSQAVLLHIADSAYPTGSFAHAGGLEYAVRAGWVHDEDSLLQWTTEALCFAIRPLDGRACVEAWRLAAGEDLKGLERLNRRLTAFRSSSTARAAQSQMGRSFLEITSTSYDCRLIGELGSYVFEDTADRVESDWIQFAVAWGAVCRWLTIEERDCVDTLLFAVARQWALAAVRTIPIGQTAANRVLAAVAREVAGGSARPESGSSHGLQSFSPALEIAAMGQGSLPARYFRS